MKNSTKLIQYSSLILTVFFLSCSKDDNESASPDISGTWIYKSGYYAFCDAPNDEDFDSDFDGCDDGNCYQLILRSNKTFTKTIFWTGPPASETVSNGSFTQSGNTITFTCTSGECDDLVSEVYTIVLTENELTFSGERNYDGGDCEKVRAEIWVRN